jgi:hypothetical protein
VQIIWAPKLRLPEQGAKHHNDHEHSKMDRQIRGLTHPDPYCLDEWRREEGFGRRRQEARFGFLKRRTASTSAPPIYIFSVHGSKTILLMLTQTLWPMNQSKPNLLSTLAQEEFSWTKTTHGNTDLTWWNWNTWSWHEMWMEPRTNKEPSDITQI